MNPSMAENYPADLYREHRPQELPILYLALQFRDLLFYSSDGWQSKEVIDNPGASSLLLRQILLTYLYSVHS